MYERRSFSPVKVGEEIVVKIEAVGEKGDGLAKRNGFVIFVPNTKAGDEVKVKITKVLRKVGFAEVVGQGSVGESSEEPQSDASGNEEQQSEESSEESTEEESSEDSEDFGEEEK